MPCHHSTRVGCTATSGAQGHPRSPPTTAHSCSLPQHDLHYIVLFAYGVYAKGATLLVCAALAIAWLLVVMVVAAAMSGIYQTALYRYAAGHETARFGNVDLGQAFRARR